MFCGTLSLVVVSLTICLNMLRSLFFCMTQVLSSDIRLLQTETFRNMAESLVQVAQVFDCMLGGSQVCCRWKNIPNRLL
jgi:hypothetical protein